MNAWKNQPVELPNPYSRRYQELRESVLEAATNTWDEIDGIAIELVEGYFSLFGTNDSDYPDVSNGYEALRYLHDRGVLDDADEYCTVHEMRRHDVAFGLALYENEAAHFLVSDKAVAHGWKQAEARQLGELAAMSARQSYEWGLTLKAKCLASHSDQPAEKKCRDDYATQYWVFRSASDSSWPFWRWPSIVWQAADFHKPGRPMPHPLALNSRPMKAVAAAIEYRNSPRGGHQAAMTRRGAGCGRYAGNAGNVDIDLNSKRRVH